VAVVTISTLAKALPGLYETQASAFEFMDKSFPLSEEQRALYRRLMLDGPIEGRYFGMDRREDSLEDDPDFLNARFLKYGRMIAAEASGQAMQQAEVKPEQVRGLVTNTCTGYLCPGFSSYLCEDLALSDRVHVLDIMGMGCGGAIPNLRSAAGLLRAGCGQPVLSVSVEICSATIFMADDPGLTVSNAIFGDGAAAALLCLKEVCAPGDIELLDFETVADPSRRELLRYRQEGGRLRNQLSPKVPFAGARLGALAVERLLKRNGIDQTSVRHWAVHAGGTAVLDQVKRTFAFSGNELASSYEVFRRYGNMSSPSVLFVLMEELERSSPERGATGVLLSFGAGFTAFAALVRFW
jgi:alkylresorcinol/alkylpyrone synthase